MRIVLWDVDGTLLLNGGRAGRLYDDAIRDVTGFQPSGGQRPAEHGKTDAQIITERLAEYDLDTGLLTAVRERLDDLSEAGNAGEHARRLAPGVVPALHAIAAAGWGNGVLTGNSPARVRHKFTGAGLDLGLFDWDHAYYGHETTVRADIARRARAELGDAPAVIVGDTPSDGEAAAAAGLDFVAVATGAFDATVLHGTGAALVVEDLEQGLPDVLAVLERLGQGSSAAR